MRFAPNSWDFFSLASLGFLFTTKQLKLKQQRVWVIASNRLLTVPQAGQQHAAADQTVRGGGVGGVAGFQPGWQSSLEKRARAPKHRLFFSQVAAAEAASTTTTTAAKPFRSQHLFFAFSPPWPESTNPAQPAPAATPILLLFKSQRGISI